MPVPKTYLIEVAPIAKNSSVLSYFSTVKLKSGSLVKIPLRKGATIAIVLSAKSAQTEKTEIRQARFTLKKIRQSDILDAELGEDTLTAIERTARFYASPIGAILKTLLPKFVLEDAQTLIDKNSRKRKLGIKSPREPVMLQMESAERFGQYRLLLRQTFAKNGSVIFLVPTERDALKAYAELSRGITEYTYRFDHRNKNSWGEALKKKHPILFITTPAGLMLPRRDIKMIIMDRENSRAYRSLGKPYLNYKKFAELLCREKDIELVMGDAVLSIEALHNERRSMHRDGESSLIRWRLSAAPARLVDSSTKQNEDGRFEIFSKELIEFIRKALEKRRGVFLFGLRKGLSPSTVCGDCGFVLPCKNCGAPVVLHGQRQDLKNPRGLASGRIYVCHACSAVRDPKTVCDKCGSWKLVPLGIGTQEIARLAKTLFPNERVEILDKDNASTEIKAKNIAKKFNEEGGIVVGTELAFFYLDSVAYSAIVSLDALFSMPDFSINERVFYLISHLRELTETELLIQSRNIGKQILTWAASGNIIDFYQDEIQARQEFLYPPFSIFIKITGQGDLKTTFKKWQPDILKDSIIIRSPREDWPDAELVEKLALLGPQFMVKVDPETIL